MSRRPSRLWAWRRGVSIVACGALLACGGTGADEGETRAGPAPTRPSVPTSQAAPVVTEPPSTTTSVPERLGKPPPAWLGTRVLEIDPATGYGVVVPTPPELVDRRLHTIDRLPRPASDDWFARVEAVPPDVLARSTWQEGCPVEAADLRYLQLPFHGFDGLVHTGELLVHADAVDAVVAGFELLFAARFPIEEMRVVTEADLDAPPTGDGNNTTAFVCRPSRGSTSWSQHALGRAVDINPFHNPYVKGDVVLPELASSYTDRSDVRPGMLTADLVAGFTGHGWGWGGAWTSVSDPMHLSANGR